MLSLADYLSAAAALLALAPPVAAHSWVEQVRRIAPNGTMVGPVGFMRGYVGRDAPGFSDTKLVWLVPPNGQAQGNVILPDQKLLRPEQRTSNYANPSYPMLSAAPGDLVALQYQENGHVSLPANQKNKPDNRGTIYIYGTTDLDPNTNFLDVHKNWTADGQGGNKKGRLLATRNFDDGQCYQINGGAISTLRQKAFSKTAEVPQGADLWCQSDIQLPSDLAAGSTYTLIWLWDWPTMSGETASSKRDVDEALHERNFGDLDKNSTATISLLEYYVSGITVSVVEPCSDVLGEVKGPSCGASSQKSVVKFIADQNLNWAAVHDQLQNPFLVDVPQASGFSASTVAPLPTATKTKGGHGAVKTVTITENVATVTVTATALATTAAAAAPSNVLPIPVTSVTPFLALPSKVRRGPGEWRLGH